MPGKIHVIHNSTQTMKIIWLMHNIWDQLKLKQVIQHLDKLSCKWNDSCIDLTMNLHQLIRVSCYCSIILMELTPAQLQIIGLYLKNMLHFKWNKIVKRLLIKTKIVLYWHRQILHGAGLIPPWTVNRIWKAWEKKSLRHLDVQDRSIEKQCIHWWTWCLTTLSMRENSLPMTRSIVENNRYIR